MLQKSTSPDDSSKSSKDQKRFYELLERIQLLKKLIEEKKELASKISQIRNEQLVPLMNQLRTVKLAQVRALHWAYDRYSFAKRLKIRLQEEILDRIKEIFQNYPLEADQEKEITEILARHSGTTTEELQETLREDKEEQTREYLRTYYGIELNEDESADLNDPLVIEKIRAKIAVEANHKKEYEYIETESDRQKIKANSLQDKLGKSIRSVYTSLIKHLHPDKEMDEVKKNYKTEAIKEVTIAYENKDMLALLILQSKHGIMEETLEDSEIRTYNTVLKKQVADLEKQHATIIQTTQGLTSESALNRFFKSEKTNLKKHIRYEQGLLQGVFENEEVLMDYLRQGY